MATRRWAMGNRRFHSTTNENFDIIAKGAIVELSEKFFGRFTFKTKGKMRTQKEILARIDEIREEDFFGVEQSDLIGYLDFDNAKPFLKPETTEASWTEILDKRVTPLDEMKKYMSFALDKAENHRGLSAGRSVSHFRAWLWLIGDDELLAFINKEENYRYYGVPILRKIGEKYNIPLPTDETWFNNMSNGNRCSADCREGCSI